MYATLLSVHSIARWLVILAGIAAAASALRAATSTSRPLPPTPGLVFTVLYDIQVLIGLLLYVRFSPLTTAAFRNLDGAMANDLLRFWVVEHPVVMIAGLALAHLARAAARRSVTNPRLRRRVAIYYSLAFIAALLATPWPFMSYGRPMF